LTLTLNSGPQSLVNGICRTLHIATDHFVMIDMSAFADVVNAMGGLAVDIPHPIRDAYTGLNIGTAGPVHLNGTQLLALVRSRQAEQFIDGHWVAQNEVDGATARAHWAGVVFTAVGQAARSRNPITQHRLAWALTGGTTTDSGTGLLTLRELRGIGAAASVLPVNTQAGVLAATLNEQSQQVITGIFGQASCTPSR
jgi:hypothetical protein